MSERLGRADFVAFVNVEHLGRNAPARTRPDAAAARARRELFDRVPHIGKIESRSLSESTRRIVPRTKNGHAPPNLAETRKSCQSSQRPGRVSFPALSQIKPQAPLLVVPFRQFLQVSALQPYFPRNPKTPVSLPARPPRHARPL